jgi:hypothetical protein
MMTSSARIAAEDHTGRTTPDISRLEEIATFAPCCLADIPAVCKLSEFRFARLAHTTLIRPAIDRMMARAAALPGLLPAAAREFQGVGAERHAAD